jgi:hypothetical protein
MNFWDVVETDLTGPANPMFSASVHFLPEASKGAARRSEKTRATRLSIRTPPRFAAGGLEAESGARVSRLPEPGRDRAAGGEAGCAMLDNEVSGRGRRVRPSLAMPRRSGPLTRLQVLVRRKMAKTLIGLKKAPIGKPGDRAFRRLC